MINPNTYYIITLFIAGEEPNSKIALNNLNQICAENLRDKCEIEVVDVFNDFDKAFKERIIVTPTLIVRKKGEKAITRFFGNLENRHVLLQYFNLNV